MADTTELRTWTRAELLARSVDTRIRRGTTIRIATRVNSNGFYELISPCCGKRTYADGGYIDQMLSGRWPDQQLECGKPWTLRRGNPRNGGCRARYDVRPALVADGRVASFDLTWTGQ
jgi:hypothetical protein